MTLLSLFLFIVVAITFLLVTKLTKQFQEENLINSYQKTMKNSNTFQKSNHIEKEKEVAEILNGRFAMIGLIAAIGAYLTTGQIIPGFV